MQPKRLTSMSGLISVIRLLVKPAADKPEQKTKHVDAI